MDNEEIINVLFYLSSTLDGLKIHYLKNPSHTNYRYSRPIPTSLLVQTWGRDGVDVDLTLKTCTKEKQLTFLFKAILHVTPRLDKILQLK